VEAKGEPALLLLTTLRWAETPEDQALTDAGWSLPAPYLAGWGMLAVDGASSYDGMCRPLGYNGFVFVAGIFAGTISPDLMDSRTTGAGTITSLQNGRVNARYVRCHRFEQARPLRLAALRIALYAHVPTSTRARCVAARTSPERWMPPSANRSSRPEPPPVYADDSIKAFGGGA
jgi:hypothetical protein